MIDPFGREVVYLRVSVTDRCDFRCVYCMEEQMEFLPRASILTLEEFSFIGRAFTELGSKKITHARLARLRKDMPQDCVITYNALVSSG